MSKDKYTSLAALKEQVGKDNWRIRCLDRGADVTIIAPHGGYIDAGTSALAQAIAGRRFNLFDFQGLQRTNPLDLHVTATNFRDPQLSQLLKRSKVAVSVHCMGPQGQATIWLGGLNAVLKQLVLNQLQQAGFHVDPNSPMYRGENPRNVVNLAAEHGVQLELSTELVTQLYVGKPFLHSGRLPRTTPRFDELVAAVRSALRQYQQLRNVA
jgi:phage replication-related protein YjqB (UPF0714/DUF867 family)